jgi:DeoR/GlpR family transcriptional regulator of sugar metabolism
MKRFSFQYGKDFLFKRFYNFIFILYRGETSMPRKKTERAKIHAVAYLIGQENASRKEVAARLGISLATVTRAIEEAKEEGWLQITHHFIADNLSPEERREYEQIVSPTIDIQRKINKFVEHNKTTVRPITHVYSILKRRDESNLTAFTRAIANDIKELLFQSHICGVSWGHTLASIVSHLQTPEMRPSRGRERNILFVPVCGESIEDYSYESDDLDAVSIEGQDDMTSSSVLSLQLDHIFNRVMMDKDKPERRRKQLTLRAIPALIPMEFDEDEKEKRGEVEVILKFINRIRPYRDIFSKDG